MARQMQTTGFKAAIRRYLEGRRIYNRGPMYIEGGGPAVEDDEYEIEAALAYLREFRLVPDGWFWGTPDMLPAGSEDYGVGNGGYWNDKYMLVAVERENTHPLPLNKLSIYAEFEAELLEPNGAGLVILRIDRYGVESWCDAEWLAFEHPHNPRQFEAMKRGIGGGSV